MTRSRESTPMDLASQRRVDGANIRAAHSVHEVWDHRRQREAQPARAREVPGEEQTCGCASLKSPRAVVCKQRGRIGPIAAITLSETREIGVTFYRASGTCHCPMNCTAALGDLLRRGSTGMSIPRRHFLRLASGAVALPVSMRIAGAQTYPTRLIAIVLPLAPGGALDVLGRILAPRMAASLGQAIILENVPGANGSLGVGRVARAAPDGYTLVIGYWGTHVANGAIYALKYDVLNDFEPVSLLATQPFLIVAKKAMPADDLKGLIAWLKVNPGKASAGTAGVGATDHVGGVLFQAVTDTHFQFVPYRGAGPAVQDLVAGQMDIMFESPTITLPQVRSGQVKAFAVAAKSRLAAAPEIPTVDEAGLPGFYVTFWAGLWAPKGTPKDVIAKLNSAAVTALADPAVRARFTDLGLEIYSRDQQTPEALAAYQKAEIEKWWPIIKAAGIKVE
jgi:tripartite-type tricarboxylate transporter receptor subunit TctC